MKKSEAPRSERSGFFFACLPPGASEAWNGRGWAPVLLPAAAGWAGDSSQQGESSWGWSQGGPSEWGKTQNASCCVLTGCSKARGTHWGRLCVTWAALLWGRTRVHLWLIGVQGWRWFTAVALKVPAGRGAVAWGPAGHKSRHTAVPTSHVQAPPCCQELALRLQLFLVLAFGTFGSCWLCWQLLPFPDKQALSLWPPFPIAFAKQILFSWIMAVFPPPDRLSFF